MMMMMMMMQEQVTARVMGLAVSVESWHIRRRQGIKYSISLTYLHAYGFMGLLTYLLTCLLTCLPV